MKYLAAFVIGVGLMTNGQAVAENLVFPTILDSRPTELFKCLEAQKNGIEIEQSSHDNTGFFSKKGREIEKEWTRVFVSRQEGSYLMHWLTAQFDFRGYWEIGCFERGPLTD